MDLESKKTFESQSTEGVKFTLRRLNQRQRAKRDLAVADEKLEYSELLRQFIALQTPWEEELKRLKQEGITDEPERSSEEIAKLRKLDYGMGLLLNAHIKPATIKAALVKVEGLTLDGKPYTPESFVDQCDNDALIDEIWTEAEKLSGLTVRQAEVFSSPSLSDEAAAGVTNSTTATNANTGDATETETVLSTSQSA